MKKLSFLVSRQFLALAALLVIALVIWFVGPLVAFSGLKPLAPVGMRVLAIALMLAGVLLWLAGWSASVFFVALLCLLIWQASPFVTVGREQPFVSASARMIAIALLLAISVLYWAFLLLQKMRSEPQFLQSLLEFGRRKEASPAAARLENVHAIVSTALARLKAIRTGARGIGRLFQGTRYLYELPWYITLGAQGSGKTSALLNAGLPFPLAAQMQRTAGALLGTESVEWWLTNEAVLIDTAGHYTRHGTSQNGRPASTRATVTSKAADKATATSRHEDAAATSETVASPAANHPDSNRLHEKTDADEWLGFLAMLRKHRPRAPINGAIVTVELAALTSLDDNAHMAEAAALRARLAELRETLGIRFPVYLVVTKMDRLCGFNEYFASLTAEGRAQPWGFTLPYGKESLAARGMRTRCDEELALLTNRLAEGVNTRLQDEFDPARRRQLVALSEEFAALSQPLGELVERVFLDSRYDATQLHAALRGVYFTSAIQAGDTLVAERRTIARRLSASPDRVPGTRGARPAGNQSYFLHDLLTKVVFAEAQLVRPNLRWEFRFRLLRFIGHALAVLLFAWLAIGLRLSFAHNSDYLSLIGRKSQALAAKVAQLYKEPKPDAVPDTLTEARYLPTFPGLDMADPDSTFRFGLYTAPEVVAESRRTFDVLEDNLLLPPIVRRMENVISQAVTNKDSKTAYDALRVYLMLYDKPKFHADDVKAWVLDDWANTDSAAVFGGRASMIEHVQQLFSGSRVVQSPLIRNDSLVQQARSFLDGSNATARLYERARAAMQKEAPDEFTLIRAVGPQAGLVFTRASGAPLSRGVPGLFTFDGYRQLFDKRVSEFVEAARDDDAWVMGRTYLGEAQKKTAEFVSAASRADDPLTEAIRRQYLTEYARQWDAFLGDIRTVNGTSLQFDLQVLRSFAAPDSPLARLARAAVRETTLTQAVAAADASLLQKAADRLSEKADKTLGIRASEIIERELVDSHFAALREVVTGNADGQAAVQAGTAQVDKTGLDGVGNLLNDYYTALTVADNALANNSMPPASDTAARLKMTANTMPPPLRAVLLALAADGSREVNQGIGQLLSRQMQAVVGDTCRLTIEGNYPFAAGSQREVRIDDFTRVFAQGGVIDDFFVKTLSAFVDTSATPWRYKTLAGATEPVQGPELEPFQHAKAIRDIFFANPDRKQLSWKAEIRIPELDPTITGLMIDIDGQTTLYQHGPVTPFPVTWPGTRGGVHAEVTAEPRIRPETSTLATDGPWALMRLVQKGQVAETTTPGRTRVAFDFDGRKAVLDIAGAGSVANPLTSDVLKTFKCPSSMRMLTLTDSGPPPGLPPGIPAEATGASH